MHIGTPFGTRGSNGQVNRVVGEWEYFRQTWHERPFCVSAATFGYHHPYPPVQRRPSASPADCCTDLTLRRDSALLRLGPLVRKTPRRTSQGVSGESEDTVLGSHGRSSPPPPQCPVGRCCQGSFRRDSEGPRKDFFFQKPPLPAHRLRALTSRCCRTSTICRTLVGCPVAQPPPPSGLAVLPTV